MSYSPMGYRLAPEDPLDKDYPGTHDSTSALTGLDRVGRTGHTHPEMTVNTNPTFIIIID
jgi:hypothetical protein